MPAWLQCAVSDASPEQSTAHAAPAKPRWHSQLPSSCAEPWLEQVSTSVNSHRGPAARATHSHGGSSVAAPPLASHVPADEQCACVPLAVEQSAVHLFPAKLLRESGRGSEGWSEEARRVR